MTRFQEGLFLLGVLLLTGCAGVTAHQQGIELRDRGELEAALAQLEKATREAPENREFRINYLNTRAQIIGRLLADAEYEKSTGNFEVAETLYRRVLGIDRDNAQAVAGLVAIEQGRRHVTLLTEAKSLIAVNNLEAADQKLALVLRENPQHTEARALRQSIEEKAGRNDVITPGLRQTFQKPVTLEFRETSLRQVLEALSLHSGLNFILDKDVPPSLVVTVFLRQVSVEDALDVILTTNQLRRRVINDTTLLIYPDTVAKQGEHQDLIVKNFFLANAEAKQVMNMLKTVLKAKNVFADDKLNLLIMRDTPAMIRLADRMITIQDVGEPEVMLEVEILEIQRSSLLNIGVQLPDQLTLSPLPSNGVNLTLQDLKNLNSSRTGATLTPAIINLQRQVGETNLLANPRIRTHNREKAMIRIGDRVPVITTTATSTGFLSENVLYIDVGLKLEVEPTIYPNNEISIKMALEVSSVVREIISKSGTTSFQLGSRNASTVLRLKDGETQILGGLINDEDRMNANRFPGLGDLPVLGRLFSSQKDDRLKTELILSITPRLVRGLAPPPDVPGEFWSGTENDPRLNSTPLPRGNGTSTVPAASTEAPATPVAPVAPPLSSAPIAEEGPGITGSPVTDTAPALRWEGPEVVKENGIFALTLKTSDPQATPRLPMKIRFDPATLDAVDVLPGNAIRVEAAPGSILLSRNGATAARTAGKDELLTVRFRALKPSQNSVVTALPSEPPGQGSDSPGATVSTVIGITVTP